MNFFAYMESRYVSVQIALNSKQGTATANVAQAAATRAHMWLWLKLASLFYFVSLPLGYLAVLLHLHDVPPTAAALALEANAAKAEESKKNEALAAKISKDILKGATKDRADAGLDSWPEKGSA